MTPCWGILWRQCMIWLVCPLCGIGATCCHSGSPKNCIFSAGFLSKDLKHLDTAMVWRCWKCLDVSNIFWAHTLDRVGNNMYPFYCCGSIDAIFNGKGFSFSLWRCDIGSYMFGTYRDPKSWMHNHPSWAKHMHHAIPPKHCAHTAQYAKRIVLFYEGHGGEIMEPYERQFLLLFVLGLPTSIPYMGI